MQKPSAWALAAASSSRLRVAVAERVMALAADGGVAAKADEGVVETTSNTINRVEQLLAEEHKYKVVGFDLEYTDGHVGHDHMVVIAQLFVNSPDYTFATVDTTNDLKVLNTPGLSCQKLVNIQGQYMVWGGKKKQKESLVDFVAAIINPYYRDMKAECEKEMFVWHHAWVNEVDEEHINYATKDVYTSYKIYMRIVDMRKCLLPTHNE
ncbi:hypothetical protein D1007_15647 [Hordeum vulgare]|nr:hypothetical protein D1007_15647 [Hordeum vulgare]